jgi:GT2 family glycosyltransferase
VSLGLLGERMSVKETQVRFVVAVVATYRRGDALCRLLEKLNLQTLPLLGIVVVDNAAEALVEQMVAKGNAAKIGPEMIYRAMPENRGCGAGLKAGEEEALRRFPDLTHVWILDDDVIPESDCLEKLLAGLLRAKADLICPLLADEQGRLWGFPEPRAKQGEFSFWVCQAGRKIRECVFPAEALEKLGPGPHGMWWCTGACVLVSRRALLELGTHRDDYWMLGEDHEFSLRVGARFQSVFLTEVVVPHCPPLLSDPVLAREGHYRKFLALLQNLTYNALRLSIPSGPMWSYLPGNYRRFFRTFGFTMKTGRDALRAFWWGAVLGRPAGRK